MENKLSGLLFLLLLMTYELTRLQVEAVRTCRSKSRKYHCKCYSQSDMRNCKTICKVKEGFTGGLCKRRACMCSMKCGTNLPHTLTFGNGSDTGGGVENIPVKGNNPSGDVENNPGEGNNLVGGVGNNPGGDDDNKNPNGGVNSPSDGNNAGGDVGNYPDDGNNLGGEVGNNPDDGNNSGGDVGNNPGGGEGKNPGGGHQGRTQGRKCTSKSKKYRGSCYSASNSRNCKTICKIKEGFTGGVCKRGRCMCAARCGTQSLPYNVVPVELNTFEVEDDKIDGESDNVGAVVENYY